MAKQDFKKRSEKKDAHYARLRRQHRDREGARPDWLPPEGCVWLYGLHSVRAAIENERRVKRQLWLTRNARDRLGLDVSMLDFPVYEVSPKDIDSKIGSDAVHQGVLLEAEGLSAMTLEHIKDARFVIVLDQVTDPHNVGALMRSSVAMGADALVTTARHSPSENGVLAKVASGGLEHIAIVNVRNLANALTELNTRGFQTIGLDSEGPEVFEATIKGEKLALVLGAEGKGLRQKTRETVSDLARLDMPGPIKSLNVSNAAVLALYAARKHLDR